MDSSTNSSEELRCNNIMEEYLEEDIDEIELPGFRFHPTDEELVSFYLRRKLDNKPISIELIKQIDIYKYDPWDLPKGSGSTGGEKEGYFYCKRGRKYKNSIRPNRVTGSGFWKATGIDKPVYNSHDDSNIIIGLKKTLVYYRGSAGKGTKTQWMMHEFRIPPTTTTAPKNHVITNHDNILQEAEIWTLCRIFKRNASNRKCAPEWRHLGGGGGKRHSSDHEKKSTSTTSVTVESSAITTDSNHHYPQQAYINFGDTRHTFFQEHKPVINNSNYYYNQVCVNTNNKYLGPNSVLPQPPHQLLNASVVVPSSSSSSSSPLSFWINHPTTTTTTTTNDDLFAFDNSSWDELGSVVQFPL